MLKAVVSSSRERPMLLIEIQLGSERDPSNARSQLVKSSYCLVGSLVATKVDSAGLVGSLFRDTNARIIIIECVTLTGHEGRRGGGIFSSRMDEEQIDNERGMKGNNRSKEASG